MTAHDDAIAAVRKSVGMARPDGDTPVSDGLAQDVIAWIESHRAEPAPSGVYYLPGGGLELVWIDAHNRQYRGVEFETDGTRNDVAYTRSK